MNSSIIITVRIITVTSSMVKQLQGRTISHKPDLFARFALESISKKWTDLSLDHDHYDHLATPCLSVSSCFSSLYSQVDVLDLHSHRVCLSVAGAGLGPDDAL